MDKFFIRVGFTTVRPIIPDQHFTNVVVMADSANDAQLAAAQMVQAGVFDVQMVTSTQIVSVEV